MAESGIDADFFVFRDRSADKVLPWDIIDGGLKDNFFRSEFDKALRQGLTKDLASAYRLDNLDRDVQTLFRDRY